MTRYCHRNQLLALNAAIALGAIVGASAVDAGNAAAAAWRQRAPWCAYLGGVGGNFDCSYYTFQQCMSTARGLGGYCSPNARGAYDPYAPRRRGRR